MVAFGLLAAACSSDGFLASIGEKLPEMPKFRRSAPPPGAPFLGALVVDEPRAAIVGRDILAAGGNAADAAAAMYFALSVTLPGSASLGGGGVCAVHDGTTTEMLEFLPRAPAQVPSYASRPTAIPGNLRGFYDLHARFGRLRWERIIAPAESMARFGVPVSRALADSLKPVKFALLPEIETRRILGRDGGRRLVEEGEMLVQLDLAVVLGRLRRQGPGVFYGGTLGNQFVAEVADASGSLSRADLRGYRSRWLPTIKVPFGQRVAHFAAPPAAGGAVAAGMWSMLADTAGYAAASSDVRPHLLAEVAMRAYADRQRWMRDDGTSTVADDQLVSRTRLTGLLRSYRPDRHVPAATLSPAPVERPENPSATGFVVIDRLGSAVACGVTLNNPFGTGRIARGMGIVLAALPGKGGRGAVSLGPMLVLDGPGRQLYYASSATGGVVAPPAMVTVAARNLLGGESLAEALTARRVHHGGAPDRTFYEHGLDSAIVDGLKRRGHDVAPTPVLGLVNAVSCPGGLPAKPLACVLGADPRGSGAVATAPQ